MKTKTIMRIIPSQKVNMGGIILDQPLPVQGVDQVDPFLLIHHWDDMLPGNQHQREVGVGPHPHRGFSPVTFIFEGNVEHNDSLGNRATVHAGGTQWMHAGRGITHSERPSASLAASGGKLEFIQFWVNSPSAQKMNPAYYLPVSKEDTPRIDSNGSHIAVVAGEYKGLKGPAQTLSPMTLLRGEINADEELTIDLPETFNTIIYFLDGKVTINDQDAKAKDLVQLSQEGNTLNLSASETSRFIVLSGEPINEEVTSYGPFVMNTQTEVMQALRDAQSGKMGVLIEEFDQQ